MHTHTHMYAHTHTHTRNGLHLSFQDTQIRGLAESALHCSGPHPRAPGGTAGVGRVMTRHPLACALKGPLEERQWGGAHAAGAAEVRLERAGGHAHDRVHLGGVVPQEVILLLRRGLRAANTHTHAIRGVVLLQRELGTFNIAVCCTCCDRQCDRQ